MKICSNAEELRNALNEIQPSKVAVAFVGNGWKNYINSEQLKEIILSPTLGSNPKAIEEIMNTIGADNVYFLDNLHAKIYLGTELALLGSCNLSDNGFSDNGNFEAGIVFSALSAPNNFKTLESVFENYKAEAKRQYPTAKSKELQLHKLYKQWQNAILQKTIPPTLNDNPPITSIGDYISKLDRIHIAWWCEDEVDYNLEVIRKVVPNINNLDDYFSNINWFLEEDEIKESDWILFWKCNRDGSPNKRTNPYWQYVHYVIPKGVKNNYGYTKLVGQARNLDCSPPPFTLDGQTNNLIWNELNWDRGFKS